MKMSHQKRHNQVKAWTQDLINLHRGNLGIEEKWQISIEFLCDVRKDIAGLIEWIPDTYEATLSIRCDLPYGLIRWEVVHELVELSKYRSGTAVGLFVEHCKKYEIGADLFMGQYRTARNQEVENEVGRYLGERRPTLGTFDDPCAEVMIGGQ